ncbi:MAG: CDP-diacylglycerol--serine O-phosphatidyltransferase, partial [Deltaproteobacteria bacterium]
MKRGRGKRGRGVPFLPNGLTAANLLCGFFSLVNSHHGRFGEAALLILFAAFLDALDGRVARLTGSSSGFGREFDSLADLVSFG